MHSCPKSSNNYQMEEIRPLMNFWGEGITNDETWDLRQCCAYEQIVKCNKIAYILVPKYSHLSKMFPWRCMRFSENVPTN